MGPKTCSPTNNQQYPRQGRVEGLVTADEDFILFLFIYFINLFYLFIYFAYLFLAALGLRCCARAFSICGEQRLPFIAV